MSINTDAHKPIYKKFIIEHGWWNTLSPFPKPIWTQSHFSFALRLKGPHHMYCLLDIVSSFLICLHFKRGLKPFSFDSELLIAFCRRRISTTRRRTWCYYYRGYFFCYLRWVSSHVTIGTQIVNLRNLSLIWIWSLNNKLKTRRLNNLGAKFAGKTIIVLFVMKQFLEVSPL